MISTTEYEARKTAFLAFKDSLVKEPGSGKKEYWVTAKSKDDWDFIHDELKKDGSLEDNIPTDSCDCSNECIQSDIRGTYLLTDAEATALKNHPKVDAVHLNAAKYPGTFMDNPDDVADVQVYRYSSEVKHQKNVDASPNIIPSSPDRSLLNRGGYQLLRHQQKADPWYTGSAAGEDAIKLDRIKQNGTGKDIDVIVGDQDMWFGHIEFQNNLGISTITSVPENYVGGNALVKSGISTTQGTCDLLDLVLDAPYYLDPDWFNADPSNRLMIRWDGTTVPTENYARDWWRNDSTSHRSSKFVSSGKGGTATGTDAFGTVYVNGSYTRARSNGSNTAYQTGSGYHGTPCASQAYGRQYGWAYNSNKWFLNFYGSYNSGWESGFDMQRIFHQIKPKNSKYSTQDPTISSNSWGHRMSTSSSGYYYFRAGTTGSGGVSYSSKTGTFMGYYTGDGLSFTSAREYYTDPPHGAHAAIIAGQELCDSGVIFVCSAGNYNQKLVYGDHADYNNYHASSDNTELADATVNGYSSMNGHPMLNTHSRPGYPRQIGKVGAGNTYKSIGIGALDDDNHSSHKERRVSYTNVGEAVDCYTAADQTLAACDDNISTRYNRYDDYYKLNGTNSVESEDTKFSGTSSACPISVGLIATKLEYNRSWTYADVRTWLQNNVGNADTSEFYVGPEPTTATDSDWADDSSIRGGSPIVLWDALTGNEFVLQEPRGKILVGDGLSLKGFSISLRS